MPTCFVCGKGFTDFDEMFRHVRDNHEYLRDYVNCPKCTAAVSRLHIHYRRFHKGETPPSDVPKNATHQHTIGADGKMKTKKPHFYAGLFDSAKNNKKMHYRSKFEWGVYEALELMPNVKGYVAEPFPIKYQFEGVVRNYHPDLLIELVDGRREVWEIKPASQTERPVNRAKWEACAAHCRSYRYEFKVITEKGSSMLRRSVGLPARKEA